MTLPVTFPVTGAHIDAHTALHKRHNATLFASDYGAVGDGVTDDTAALSDAMAAAATAHGELALGPGSYRITDTITALQNAAGVVVRGVGLSSQYGAASRLVWDGPADGRAMLDASGIRYSRIEGLGIYGNALTPGVETDVMGIHVQGNPTYAGSFFCELWRCYFQNCAIGLNIGAATDQADSMTLDKCWFYYSKQTGVGVKINSTNALVIQLHNCTMSGVSNVEDAVSSAGIWLLTGSIKSYGCITGNNKYGIRIGATPTGTSGIFGHHSENDRHPIYTDSVGGNHQKANPLTVRDFYAYACQESFFHFANEDMQYNVGGAYCQPAGGSMDIYVPDAPQEVILMSVTLGDGGLVRRVSDGAEVAVLGYYGQQGPAAWAKRFA